MNRLALPRVAAATTLLGCSMLATNALAAIVSEIPVTTHSASARMDFIAGQAALADPGEDDPVLHRLLIDRRSRVPDLRVRPRRERRHQRADGGL